MKFYCCYVSIPLNNWRGINQYWQFFMHKADQHHHAFEVEQNVESKKQNYFSLIQMRSIAHRYEFNVTKRRKRNLKGQNCRLCT